MSVFTPPEETEQGTRPGGRGPGGVPGGVGSKKRGGGACARIQRVVYSYTEGGAIPIAILSVCPSVCLSYLNFIIFYIEGT